MAQKTESYGARAGDDTDLVAVRRLMAQQADTHVAAVVAPDTARKRTDVRPPRAATHTPAPAQSALFRHSGGVLKAGYTAARVRIRSYRPETKRILWTALVLMLLLQPFFVLGWSLALCASVCALYWYLGADEFCRRIIDLYRRGERRAPHMARQVKLRAYVVAKKWDYILLRLPEVMANRLRLPDLRDVLAADAAHSEIMSDRLTRLDRDAAAS